MTSDQYRSPFEHLKDVYDETLGRCEACGYEVTEADWTAKTNGHTVTYERECPSCGATITHTLERET